MAHVAKKEWLKPEVKVLEAGSAETQSKGSRGDGGTKSGTDRS